MLKSIAIYSIALAGFKKIFAYIMFLSINSGVVVDSSNTTLKSVKPNAALMLPERINLACKSVPCSRYVLVEQQVSCDS